MNEAMNLTVNDIQNLKGGLAGADLLFELGDQENVTARDAHEALTQIVQGLNYLEFALHQGSGDSLGEIFESLRD